MMIAAFFIITPTQIFSVGEWIYKLCHTHTGKYYPQWSDMYNNREESQMHYVQAKKPGAKGGSYCMIQSDDIP